VENKNNIENMIQSNKNSIRSKCFKTAGQESKTSKTVDDEDPCVARKLLNHSRK